MTENEKLKTFIAWKDLINMSAEQLIRFATSDIGRAAGLSRPEAKKQGIKSGRDSAIALIRMIPKGRGFVQAMENWTPAEWRWAKRQISFIKRMRGMAKRIKGNPFYRNGTPTRWLASLMIWGHDPRRYED